MRTMMKVLFILLGVGIIFIMAAVVFLPDWNLFAGTFNDDRDYGEMLTYEEDEVVTGLKLELENRHIMVNYVESDKLTINYYAEENDTFTFDIVDDVIVMTHDFESFWLNIFSWNMVSRQYVTVTVNIPDTWALESVDLKTMTGDIDMDFEVEKTYQNVRLYNRTGSMDISNVTALELYAHTDTGDIDMSDISVSGDYEVELSTGDMTLNRVSADTFSAKSSTGDIELTGITANDATVDNSTGRISISDSTFTSLNADISTGRITLNHVISNSYMLESSTGDIVVTLATIDDYRFDLETDTGKIKINGNSQGEEYQSLNGSIIFNANTNTGNITIEVGA